jgi:hypothetical protein
MLEVEFKEGWIAITISNFKQIYPHYQAICITLPAITSRCCNSEAKNGCRKAPPNARRLTKPIWKRPAKHTTPERQEVDKAHLEEPSQTHDARTPPRRGQPNIRCPEDRKY